MPRVPLLLKNTFTLTAFSVLFFNASAQSGLSAKLGEGVKFTAADSSFSLKLGARFQTLYRGLYDLNNDIYADGFLIRRARLRLEGFAYSPKLKYKLQFDFSNAGMGGSDQTDNTAANMLLDAYASWDFAKNLTLQFGQAKLPGNREETISSQKLQFVDRSLLNSSYSLGRNPSIQLLHTFSAGNVVFKETASIARGKGRNIVEEYEDGYDYTGRVEILPFGEFTDEGDYFGSDIEREKRPKFALAFAYDHNAGAIREEGHSGDFFERGRRMKTLIADAMFKYSGFSLMTEYVDRKTAGSPVIEVDGTGTVSEAFFTGTGFNIQAGYLFKNNYEIAGRYTQINPQAATQRPDNTEYTLGISKYLSGHTVKVQGDISRRYENQEASQMMYRLQVEIGF